MTLLLAVFSIALSWLVSRRLTSIDRVVESLTLRVRELEQMQPAGAPVAAPLPRSAETRDAVAVPATPTAPRRVVEPTMAPTAVVPRAPEPRVERPAPPLEPLAATAATFTPSSDETLSATREHESLENRIGSRWLLYVGVVAVIVGAAYFEKLSIDNHWITETMRVVQGTIAGLLMAAGAHYLIRRGYDVYGQILSGCGMAVTFVAAYAAFNFYHLVPYATAFAWMGAITVLTASLGDRYRSQGLAMVAIGGGFATPFLLPSASASTAAFFTYVTCLVVGSIFLVRRRDWPMLGVVSYVATLLTVEAWLASSYRLDQYLTTELFLTLLAGLFLATIAVLKRSTHSFAGFAQLVLWSGPPLYYFASLAILGPHSTALLVYLIVLALLGVGLSRTYAPYFRPLFWCASAIPLFAWTVVHQNWPSFIAGISAWGCLFVLHLAGILDTTLRRRGEAKWPEISVVHLNGVMAFAGAYALIDAIFPGWLAPTAAALAAVHGGAAVVTIARHRGTAFHFIAVAFSLLAIALAIQVDGGWLVAGWAAEAVALMWLGLREQRTWMRLAGLALLALSVAMLFASLVSLPRRGELVILNPRTMTGLFVIAVIYLTAWVHSRQTNERRELETGLALVSATLLAFAVVAAEIRGFWWIRTAPPFTPAAPIVVAALAAACVITWIGFVRRQEWIRTTGLVVLGLAALSLLSMQLSPVTPDYAAILNQRVFAGIAAVAGCYALMQLYRRNRVDVGESDLYTAALNTAASLLTLSLVSSEIEAYWSSGARDGLWPVTRLALQSVAWTATGAVVVARGVISRRPAVRVIGVMTLLAGITVLITALFASAPTDYLPIVNARAIASVIVIAAICGLARLLARPDIDGARLRRPRIALWIAANALAVGAVTSDIFGYWQAHDLQGSVGLDVNFAREMMLTLAWSLYATGAIVVGLRRNYAPIRYFAIALFGLTILKVLFVDLSYLGQIYRVLSILGLGVLLLITSYLYQRRGRN